LDLARILTELKSERDRIDRAITLLATVGSSAATAAPGKLAVRPKRKGLTPAGRKRLSEAMKKRWAEKKRKRA